MVADRAVELEHVIALTRGRASWKSRASRVAILDHAAECHPRIELMVCLPAATQGAPLTVSDGSSGGVLVFNCADVVRVTGGLGELRLTYFPPAFGGYMAEQTGQIVSHILSV